MRPLASLALVLAAVAAVGFVQGSQMSPLSRYNALLDSAGRPKRRLGETKTISKSDPALAAAWKAGLFDPDSPAGARKKIEDTHNILRGQVYYDIKPGATMMPLNGTILVERDSGPNEPKSERHLQSVCSSVSLPSNGVSWTGSTPSSGSPTNWVLNCRAGYYRASGSFQCILAQSCGNNCYSSCCSTYCCGSSYRDWDGDRGDDITSVSILQHCKL